MLGIGDANLQLWRKDLMRRQYREIRELKAQLRAARRERVSVRGQSRKASALESLSNVFIGFGVSTMANMLILPLFGYTPDLAEASIIGIIFTVISLIRSYCMRRLFNWIGERNAPAQK